MSHVLIYVHCVWATKNREPILELPKRNILCNHIRQYSKASNIYIDCINGYKEHIHCLVSLDRQQSIANIIGVLKGESASWANKMKLFESHLQWAAGYYATSVGMNAVPSVREYIKNQEEHHAKDN